MNGALVGFPHEYGKPDMGLEEAIRAGDITAFIKICGLSRTCMAVEALASLEVGVTQRELTRQLNETNDAVAAKLVNTRSVCRSSYIHPAVFEDFQAGVLGDVLKLKD